MYTRSWCENTAARIPGDNPTRTFCENPRTGCENLRTSCEKNLRESPELRHVSDMRSCVVMSPRGPFPVRGEPTPQHLKLAERRPGDL